MQISCKVFHCPKEMLHLLFPLFLTPPTTTDLAITWESLAPIPCTPEIPTGAAILALLLGQQAMRLAVRSTLNFQS